MIIVAMRSLSMASWASTYIDVFVIFNSQQQLIAMLCFASSPVQVPHLMKTQPINSPIRCIGSARGCRAYRWR